MKIITTAQTKPPRMILYSEHKIGKSTFAANCPKPIFIDIESGLGALSVQAFETSRTYEDVEEALEFLVREEHDFRTLVVDSLDWCEKLIWEKICRDNGWSQIGDGPYGAGYKLALSYWARLIKLFDALNTSKKMFILLLAHSKVTRFEDPERDNYDRYDLDLNDKAGNLLCESVDIIGFAQLKVVAVTKKGKGFSGADITKVKGTSERILCLQKNAAYEAGNRYNIPAQIPLEWSALSDGIKTYFANQKKGKLGEVVEKINLELAEVQAEVEVKH